MEITLRDKHLAELSVIKFSIAIFVIPCKNKGCLILQNSIETLFGNLKKTFYKFLNFHVTILILVKSSECQEQVEILLPRKLAFDLFSLLLHEDLVLEELGKLL